MGALSSPPPCQWNRYSGTFGTINNIFPSLSLNVIKEATYAKQNRGEKYMGLQKERQFIGTYLIPHKTVYERTICDMLETDLGLNHTALLVNRKLAKRCQRGGWCLLCM